MKLLERIRRAGWWAWLCRAKWRTIGEARAKIIEDCEFLLAGHRATMERLDAIIATQKRELQDAAANQRAETDRRQAWLEALNQIRQVHDRQGETLASLLEAHGLVGCRLDALAEEISPVVAGSKAATGQGPEVPP